MRGKMGASEAEIWKGSAMVKTWNKLIFIIKLLSQLCNLHLDVFHSISMLISSCPALSCLLGNN